MKALARERHFPIVGRLLYQLVKLTGSRRILELGSGFGYSAYWFGLALEGDGEVVLTELSEDNLTRAKDFLKRGGIASRVQLHPGDALETVEDLQGPFDIVFNDVDKHQYPEAFKKAGRILGPGGLFISDNVLWQCHVGRPWPIPMRTLEAFWNTTTSSLKALNFSQAAFRCETGSR